MRINNVHLTGLVVSPWAEPQKIDGASREAVQRSTPENSFHTPSSEFVHWLSLAQQEPEVRAQSVARAAQLLVSGYYLSAECAERTAGALLAALE